MKQRNAVLAYKMLATMGTRVSGETAFALYGLKKKLKEIVDFQSEEEVKIVQKYGGEIAENGLVVIKENRKEFMEEWEKLGDLECEIEKISIPISQVPDIKLDEIEALDGFINFE